MALTNTWNPGDTGWPTAVNLNAQANAINFYSNVKVVTTAQTLDASAQQWVYTGTTSATWTLPAISGNTGLTYNLYNRGTGVVTVNAAGSDLFSMQGATASAFALAKGGWLQIVNDGTYWLVLAAYLPPAQAVTGIGAGNISASTAAPLTWTHPAVGVGDDVFVFFNGYQADTNVPTSVTYGSTNVPLLGSQNYGGCGFYLYRLAKGGKATSQTVTVNLPTALYCGGNSISINGVNSASAVASVATGASPMSQSVSCGPAQMILQGCAEPVNSSIAPGFSGGTNQYAGQRSGYAPNYQMVINTATVSTTFTETASTANMISLATVLS